MNSFTIKDLCPVCSKYIYFILSEEAYDKEKGETVKTIVCPFCETPLEIYYCLEPVFSLREQEED